MCIVNKERSRQRIYVGKSPLVSNVFFPSSSIQIRALSDSSQPDIDLKESSLKLLKPRKAGKIILWKSSQSWIALARTARSERSMEGDLHKKWMLSKLVYRHQCNDIETRLLRSLENVQTSSIRIRETDEYIFENAYKCSLPILAYIYQLIDANEWTW